MNTCVFCGRTVDLHEFDSEGYLSCLGRIVDLHEFDSEGYLSSPRAPTPIPLTGKPYTPSMYTMQDFDIFCDDLLHPTLDFLFDEEITVSTDNGDCPACGERDCDVCVEHMAVRTLDCHVVGEETEETTRLTLGGEEYYTYD